jgi:hypothetical protein
MLRGTTLIAGNSLPLIPFNASAAPASTVPQNFWQGLPGDLQQNFTHRASTLPGSLWLLVLLTLPVIACVYIFFIL